MRLLHKKLLTLFLCLCALVAQPADGLGSAKELLIGIEPEHNIFDHMESYQELGAYLSDQLGIKVRLTIVSRYGEVLKRFKMLGLDGAFLNSYTAAMAIHELGLQPVARPVSLDGDTITRGYLFVRSDSGIKEIEGMKGRSMVFVDAATTEGYLFPLSLFRQRGIMSIDQFFSRYYFAGSHASAIFSVLDGRADIGAAKDKVFNRIVANDPTIGTELSVIEESLPLPETTFCVKSDLPDGLKQQLAASLLEMDQSAGGQKVLSAIAALRFSKASAADYAAIADMARDAGISLTDQAAP